MVVLGWGLGAAAEKPAVAKEMVQDAEKTDQKPDGLYFVQFHHPGGEHVPDLPGERSWNTGAHARKFLRVEGSWVAAPGGEVKQGPVVFWGEWEPPSLVLQTFEQPVPFGPKYLFKPVREPFRENNPPLMNTDPFVYGGPLRYGNCKQNTPEGEPHDLQRLAPGSVILFGSNREAREFQLDTVLVVTDYLPYTTENYQTALAQGVIPEYLPISPRAISYELGVQKPGAVQTYRLYKGATPDQPLGKMFSYFPCQPWDGKGAGFARPVVKLEGLIDGTLEHGQQMNPQESLADNERLWTEITRQVLAQGLALCVAAKLPEERGQAAAGTKAPEALPSRPAAP
jgi:hypothetical protein